MKYLLATTLIAVSFSGTTLAQETAKEPVDNTTQQTQATGGNVANEVNNQQDPMAIERPMLRRPANISREGYIVAEPVDLTAERLTGARVYGANDEDIGEIDELLLSEDGSNIDQVVVDVGGFLGMGEHEVAVTMEELHIMRSEDGQDFRVYMDATQEELEAQPEYEG